MANSLSAEQQALMAGILWLSEANGHEAGRELSLEGHGERFYYINNPDGSIRWFFPASNASATFLALYNSASAKAQIYRRIIRLAFFTGQQKRLVSGAFSLPASTRHPLGLLVQSLGCHDYACFTGTAGANRKSVVACGPAKRPLYFIKVAHTAQAAALVQQEKLTLEKLSEASWKHLVFPKIYPHANDRLAILDNVRPLRYRATARLSGVHLQALAELGRERTLKPLGELAWYQQAQQDLAFLQEKGRMNNDLDARQVDRVVELLLRVNSRFSVDQKIETTLAHGDFTPWNSYLAPEKVHAYDWELADAQAPALYDFFHFHLQSGCLLRRQPFSTLAKELQRLSRSAEAADLLKGLEESRYFQLYLLVTVSRYLRMYAREKTVLTQAHWLLTTWENALASCL